MKVVNFLAILGALALTALTGCNFDFKNESEDKWIVTNNASKDVPVQFNKETVTIKEGAIGEIIKQPYDANISIANNNELYHVDFEESYNYSESKARRTLVITDQKKFDFEIENSSGGPVSFKINAKRSPLEGAGVTGTVDPDDEDLMIYTISESTTVKISFYKNKPELVFKNDDKTLPYTCTEDSKGKSYITIKS